MDWNEVADVEPTTIRGWDDNIKASGIDLKWSPQLREMHDLKVVKLPEFELALMEEQASSRFKVEYNADGISAIVGRTVERLANIANYERKIKRCKAVIKLCKEEERIRVALEKKGQVFDTPDKYKRDGSRLDVSKEIALVIPETVTRSPIGTDYFADADSGSDSNDGLSTGNAWATVTKFSQVTARSAGDTLTCRRGTTGQYSASDVQLLFDEDGTASNNIFIKADNANAFSDDVDLSVTATATLTFGSKTITFASDVSGVVAVGDVIYEANDDADLYGYEVAAVSTVTVTLFLPYKGLNAGSGKTMTNMQSNPVYGTLTDTASSWQFGGSHFWDIKGFHIKTNDSLGCVEYFDVVSGRWADMVFEIGASTGAAGVTFQNSAASTGVVFKKSRFHNGRNGIEVEDGTHGFDVFDCLFDGNSKSSSAGFKIDGLVRVFVSDTEFKGHGNGDIFANKGACDGIRFRNCLLSSTVEFDMGVSSSRGFFFIEDYQQVPSATRVFTSIDIANDDVIMQSETTTVRSGGSTISIKVIPTTQLDEIILLDIPIQASTSAKTYTVYVKSNATANWTADPTATELELSFEAWGHASNNHRKMNLSTDVADFNGVTTWEALAVTVTPAQAGVGYLRLKYRKPKESGKSNEFYVDPLVVIS